jgi:hypothetical protein
MATNWFPTGTQHENDEATLGRTVKNKQADGSPLDPNTPPWLYPAPVNNSPPVITGANPPAVGSVMACNPGAWSFANTYTYQWKRGGTNISGATVASYTVVTADKTFALTCTVTAHNAIGVTPATSAATAVVP